MKVLVIIGADVNKDQWNENKAAEVGTATMERTYTNIMPPKDSTQEGWVFFSCGKEPDWSWPELKARVGACELGRHNVDVSIPATSDIKTSLVKLYQANETETSDEGS